MSRIEKIKNIVGPYERHISSLALVGGFAFDILVLKRIDMPAENIWIIGHLLIAFFAIILLNLYSRKTDIDKGFGGIYYWMLVAVQFSFGGLLSTFLVFYFRSAALVTSWPFLLLLLAAFASNELLKHNYSRLTFQISYLFLSVFSFMIYFTPILSGRIGYEIFILSGLLSLLVILIFLLIISFLLKDEFERSRRSLFFSIGGTYLCFNILYFTNAIPPIPLSLKDAGVYHSINRELNGDYSLLREDKKWRNYFTFYEPFNYIAGDPVYIYSAVFSPTNLNANIAHEWQNYDEVKKEWTTKTRVILSVLGGREGGYRTYSISKNVFPGLWRVNVKTLTGQLIGRIRFEIKETPSKPNLILETME